MKRNKKLRTRLGGVVTAGLVASALVAAPMTMLVGAVPAMAEFEKTDQEQEQVTPVAVNNGNGWYKCEFNDLGDLSSIVSSNSNHVDIYINDDSINRDSPLEIGFGQNSDHVPVTLHLNGYQISNTLQPGPESYDDMRKTHAIIANCDLTIDDKGGESSPWTGKPDDVGRVHSDNGYAVIANDYKVTIEGGLYSNDTDLDLSVLFGTDISIKNGAFLKDPRESVPGSVTRRKVATFSTESSTENDPTTYWLVGNYVDDALGIVNGIPQSVDTSNNVVTIKQMDDSQNPNIVSLNLKELINDTNYSLHINGDSAKVGGVMVPRDTALAPGGHLSKVVALNDANTTKVAIADQTWNDGRPITPHATVTIGDETLSPSTDYYLDNFEDNTQVGTARVKVVGKGEYAGGSLDATFNIVEPVATPEEELKVVATNVGTLLNGMDKRRYTAESVSALEAAEGEANRVLAEFEAGRATKDQVQAALDNLNSAYAKLSHKAGVAMHRLYNPNSGEHFYTASAAERDHLVSVGWKSEGTGWTAPASSNTAVYRLYNPNAGDHHYTTSEAERDSLISAGWTYEGIGWFSDDSQEVPLYRQYNPNAKAGAHNFTTAREENDHLVSVGWKAEGVAWYGMSPTA